MKLATITAVFPELRVPYAYRTGRGKGSSVEIAVARACRDLFKKIEHRRVTVFKATIVIQEVAGDAFTPREFGKRWARGGAMNQ